MPIPMKQTQLTRKPGDYTVELKPKLVNTEKSGKVYLLIDNYEHICGLYGSEADAKAAIPKIKDRLIKEYKKRDKPITRKK